MQVISVFASNGETCVQTAALLDSGSDATLISESLANKLQLSGITKDIALTNVLSMTNKFPSKLVKFSILSPSHPEQLPITNAWVVHDLKFATSPGRVSSAKESLSGADHPNLHLYTETRSRNHNEPVALHTALGWVLFGGNKKTENCILNKVTLESATDIIQKFWDIESYGTVPKDDVCAMTVEDKPSVEILKETTFKSGNHYITDLLWKESNSILPNNKSLALSRLYNLERKLAKHPQIRQMYTETMTDNIKKGYPRKLSYKEANTISPRTNYITHHCVTNINKPNKLRIVFDAAAKFSNTSLNQHLLKGPDLLNSLVGILLRFREGQYAIIGDIEAMYHQVKVLKEDTDSLRFLWRENFNASIDEYILCVHIFGKFDSPCCANWALKRTAIDNKPKFSLRAIEAVLEHFYMDDYLDCFPDLEAAINVTVEVIQLLKLGGFNLTKFV